MRTLLCSLLLIAPALAATPEHHSFHGRPFLLSAPPQHDPDTPTHLVLALHGCTQDPLDFAVGTRLHEAAAARGWLTLYPGQLPAYNQLSCWNWFLPSNQTRYWGDPLRLAALLDHVDRTLARIDRVVVVGLSAGATTANAFAVTYPDRVSAVAICAGLPFAAARDAETALSAMAHGAPHPQRSALLACWTMGWRARPTPALILHGSADDVVHPLNAQHLLTQWAFLHDVALDGLADSDVLPYPDRVTLLASPNGRTYSQADILDPNGLPRIRLVLVDGMGHAWPGGDPAGSYTDPDGPDGAALTLDFFEAHLP